MGPQRSRQIASLGVTLVCLVAVAVAVIAAVLGNFGTAVPPREIIHPYHAQGDHHHEVTGFDVTGINVTGGEALR